MKSKILFALMTATIMLSIFAGLNIVKANPDYMALNPTEKIYDPTYGTQGEFFQWEINISTTISVSAWEAYLYWDPGVLRSSPDFPVVWGTFMSGAPVQGYVKRIGENAIQFGQYFTQQYTVTGTGTLAYVNFTFLLPGATTVKFLYATVWDDNLNQYTLDRFDGRIKSNRPHPVFTWSTADGRNPLPQQTIYDGGDSIVYGDVVTFDASASYDVSNLVWNGTAWVEGAGYPDIVYYRWEFGDGTFEEGADKITVTHTYTSYNKNGWLVNLTVWDSENDYWSTTWRYGGADPANTVPMWRDVAIVDIWPSLPPYDVYDEDGLDWWSWWWFDTTDYWIPNLKDPYWNYHLPPSYCSDMGVPENITVKQAWEEYGLPPLWILVTACNYGSVDEKVTVKLYAAYIDVKAKRQAGAWVPVTAQNVYLVDTFTKILKAGSGSGWSLATLWMPPKDGFYVFFATIEPASGAVVQDQDPSNNYYVMPSLFTTTAAWNSTARELVKEQSYVRYVVDLDGSGKVDGTDFNILANKAIFGKFWTTP